MRLDKVTPVEFKKQNLIYDHVFNTVDFAELNENKCQEVYYLLYHEKKYKIGLIGGLRDNTLISPFSAPNGGFSVSRNDINLQYFINFVAKLREFLLAEKISFSLTLQPDFYNYMYFPKYYYALTINNFHQEYQDINYHFHKDALKDYEEDKIHRDTRNNLKRAISSKLKFKYIDNFKEKELCYSIIRKNKVSKDRPLHLSLTDLLETDKLIKIDFFLVYLENDAIASAIIYHVAPKIVQIIYWGDLREYGTFRPMNFLAYNLFKYYIARNFEIIDLGISTERGQINRGLCEFKEKIGCTATIKHNFIL